MRWEVWLWHHHLLGVWHHASHHWRNHTLRAWHSHGWVWHWLCHWLLRSWHWWLIVGSWHTTWWVSLTLSLIVVVVSVHSLSWLEVSLEVHDQVLDELHDVWSVKHVHAEASWVLLGIVLPVSLVPNLFLLKFSAFLQFVEIYVELLSVEGVSVKLLLSSWSWVRTSVANEGIESFTFLWHQLDAFDLTELGE